MCAPTPESSGSTISTLAPLVMAVCASLNWVESLPSAFCTVNCEVFSPALVNDSFRYGASNSTYRVDVTVSGRMTATLPLPRAASGLSVDIADSELFSWLSESLGAGAEPLPDEPDDEPPLLPH